MFPILFVCLLWFLGMSRCCDLAMPGASGWLGSTGTMRGKAVVPPQYRGEGQGEARAATSSLEYPELREWRRSWRGNQERKRFMEARKARNQAFITWDGVMVVMKIVRML